MPAGRERSEQRAMDGSSRTGPTPARPLAGVRVIDLTTSYAGPTASMLLADMGADVVKIEKPGSGDDARAWGPPFVDGRSAWFMSANRNKRSIVVDLLRADGIGVLGRLLDAADVLLVSFNPSKVAKLKLDPAQVREERPRLIYCALSGFGFTGPDSALPGYDLIAQARSGLMSVTGADGGTPQRVSTALSDVTTGLVAALAIVAAVRLQEQTGQGTFIDVSLLDADLSLMAPRITSFLAGEAQPSPSGATDSVLAIYQTFEAADRPIAIAVGNDDMWQRFCSTVGLDDLAHDPALRTNAGRRDQRHRLIALIQERLRTRPAQEWLDAFRSAAIPASVIHSLAEVVADPQVRERGAIRWLPGGDGNPVGVVARPWRTDADPEDTATSPPDLGAHSRDVLAEAGYAQEQIEALVRDEVVWTPS